MLGVKPGNSQDQSESRWIGPAPWIATSLPGPNAKALIERDRRLSSPSLVRSFPLVVKRGFGSVVEDVDGNRFLDFGAGPAVCPTGHCHPQVAAAIEAQAKAFIHVCGSDFYYPLMVELMERLASLAPGAGPKHVLLTNSGAEALEAAIAIVRGHTGKEGIIAVHDSCNAPLMGALPPASIGYPGAYREKMIALPVRHVSYGDAETIESYVLSGKMPASEIAAFFVEAIDAEGGCIVPDERFLAQLQALCHGHGILLVCNEIQSGVGRTGKWFAFEHFGIVPDVILTATGIASGMPLGAVITRANVMDRASAGHGTACGGNPVCCAAALATLNLVQSGYMANAERLGVQLKAKLVQITEKRRVVANARGLGLMCAVDIVNRRTGKADPRLRDRLLRSCFERGLILLPCGEAGVRLCPPLCINEAQLDVGIRVFEEGVATAS